jgi:histone-lysine N-methyltransferase SETMAR
VEILKCLQEAVHRNRVELWPSNWILHHDNAPANKALSVKLFLAQKSVTEMEHPPYSPDLAPKDLLLPVCPKIKSALKGQRFQDIGDMNKEEEEEEEE